MTIWNELLGNQVLISAVLGWTVAQFLKTVIDMVLNRSFNPERIFGSGRNAELPFGYRLRAHNSFRNEIPESEVLSLPSALSLR